MAVSANRLELLQIADAVARLAPAPVKRKVRLVGVATAGAMKVATLEVALTSVTDVPLVCAQATLLALPPETVPVSVTTRPALASPEDVADTVKPGVEPVSSSSSLHPASTALPNTAVAMAEIPPIRVCRRE